MPTNKGSLGSDGARSALLNEEPSGLFLDKRGNRRIDALVDFAWDRRARNLEYAFSVIDYAESLLKGRARPYRYGMAAILTKKAFFYYLQRKPGQGLQLALQGLEIFKKLNRKNDVAHTSTTVGLIYLEMGETEEAHGYLKEAYRIYQELKFSPGLGVALTNLGLLAANCQRNREAARYYRDALSEIGDDGNKVALSNILNNIGATEYNEKKYGDALHWFKRSLRLNREQNNDTHTGIVLANIASVYEVMGRFRRAHKLLDLSDIYYSKGSGIPSMMEVEITRIKILSNSDSPFYDIRRAIRMAEDLQGKVKNPPDVLELMEMLPTLYKRAGLLHDAIRHYERFIEYKKAAAIQADNLRADYAEVIFNIKRVQEKEKEERKRRIQIARANRKLEELNARKNDVLRMVAHDLKTSAVVVQALSKMHISEKDSAKEARDEDDKLTLMAANHMLQLIENLKDIDAIESKQIIRRVEAVEVPRELRQWIRQNRVEAGIKKIALELNASANLPLIETDPLCLRRILDNLLSNAIKFSPPSSAVNIQAIKDNRHLEIHVHDQGPGIPESERKKLFKKFSRLSTKPSMGEPSTGLGLYISFGLSQAIGAELTTSNHPRGGAIFSLKLPIKSNVQQGKSSNERRMF